MSKTTEEKTVQSRRAFLKGAGVAGVAGLGAAFSVVTDDEAEAKSTKVAKPGGYQESDHVKAYYQAAKF